LTVVGIAWAALLTYLVGDIFVGLRKIRRLKREIAEGELEILRLEREILADEQRLENSFRWRQ
jgi:hypothetical protein